MKTETRTTPTSGHANLREPFRSPNLHLAACALRRQIDPSFIPSGITGFLLHRGDRVAVISADNRNRERDLALRFILAGFRNKINTESIAIQITERQSQTIQKKRESNTIGRRIAREIVERYKRLATSRTLRLQITSENAAIEVINELYSTEAHSSIFISRHLYTDDQIGGLTPEITDLVPTFPHRTPNSTTTGDYAFLQTFSLEDMQYAHSPRNIHTFASLPPDLNGHNRLVWISGGEVYFDSEARALLIKHLRTRSHQIDRFQNAHSVNSLFPTPRGPIVRGRRIVLKEALRALGLKRF